MPAYLFVILFFAKLYYYIENSSGENVVKPVVTVTSWVILVVYGFVLLETNLRGSFEAFPSLSCLIVGIVYLMVAFGFCFYGGKLFLAVPFNG